MQRVRVRYTKEGRVRFVSARDLASVWERALRRVDLPIHYSEGFTPHAKVSFPDALPVAVASTGEYAELTFAAPIDPGPDLARLSATLPTGMDVTTYLEVPDGAPKLARMLSETLWELIYPASDADTSARLVDRLRRRCHELLGAAHAEVVRHRPDGDKHIDVRPALIELAASSRRTVASSGSAPGAGPGEHQHPVLRAVLRNDGPTIRPTDLHTALAAPHADTESGLPTPRVMRRVAQGRHVPGGLREALSQEVEPLVPDVAAEAA